MRPATHIAILAALTVSALTANAAAAEDRYGPSRPADPADQSPVPLLSWPGKAVTAAPAKLAAVAAPALASPARAALPTSIYAPAPPVAPARYPAVYRPAEPSVPATPAVPAAPAVAASPAQPMLAGGQGDAPRFYSVHRQFGLQPDPIALSPQFLADTGSNDLAEPPPLPPPHVNPAQTANMSTAAAASQARAALASAADVVN